MKKFLLFCLSFTLLSMVSYSQELALVKEKDLFGYINKSGEEVIKPKFAKAESFSDGYAAAMTSDKKWGYIDVKGEWVIQPEYQKAKKFNSGWALVFDGVKWSYVNSKNEKLKVPSADKYFDFQENGIAIITTVDKKVGLIDRSGKYILEPQYEVIKPFSNGRARYKDGAKWGMIDTKGKVVIKAEYDEIGDYNKNGYWAKKGASFGLFMNDDFKLLEGIEKIWDFTGQSTITYAKSNGKIGFIDNKGKWVIEPTYDKVKAFNAGMAPVYKSKKWGYVNDKGELVIELKYADAEIFGDNGLAPVKESKSWGFVDKTGKVVIPFQYEITFGFSGLFSNGFNKGFIDGLARVSSKKNMGFINEKDEVIGKWYQHVELFSK
ncbi:MAG: WG repeat-containing protein [Brumimicrobium sp.]|nr:WG repeat-containing protein [Brumimicrobium sp.]